MTLLINSFYPYKLYTDTKMSRRGTPGGCETSNINWNMLNTKIRDRSTWHDVIKVSCEYPIYSGSILVVASFGSSIVCKLNFSRRNVNNGNELSLAKLTLKSPDKVNGNLSKLSFQIIDLSWLYGSNRRHENAMISSIFWLGEMHTTAMSN